MKTVTFKNFLQKDTKKKNKKKKSGLDNIQFTLNVSDSSSGGISEGILSELFAGIPGGMTPGVAGATILQHSSTTKAHKQNGLTTHPDEEEQEVQAPKVDQARQLFQALFNRPNVNRADIINAFMKNIGVTNSTAVSYYTRFLDEFGLSSKDAEPSLGQGVSMGGEDVEHAAPTPDENLSTPAPEEPDLEEPIDPNRAGVIRTVKNAHLVYKRQSEEGTYEELWIYNINNFDNDELDIRRDILAGTDIPPKKTKSADGQQSYNISTMGNAQMLKIKGLSN